MITPITPKKMPELPRRSARVASMKTPSGLRLVAAAALLAGLQQQASAETYSWVNAKITTWSDITGWSGGVAPTSDADNVITFSTTQNSNATNDLGVMEVNRIVAANSGSKSLTLSSASSGNILEFVMSSTDVLPTLQITKNSTGALNITTPFTVTDALTITNLSGQNGTSIGGAITNNAGITFDGAGTGSMTLGTGVTSGAGGITFNGSYTLIMSGNNTYAGLTDVQAGTVRLNRSGGTIANTSAVRVSGGTLEVAQSDTVGAVTLTGGLISGAGTLTGSSYSLTNTGEVSAVLAGDGVVLTKTGAGTATLSAVNTYTGATTVSEGVLELGADNAISAGSNVVLAGGELASAFNQTLGTLDLTASSTLDLSSGGSFVFADSASLESSWTGTLSIIGTFTDGASVRFGESSGGLTTAQLARITINGLDAGITIDGYLVASSIPEPSTYAVLAGVVTLGLAACRRRRV